MLEDVGHYRSGDHLAGANLPDAISVMETAANIHARWWDSEELSAMEWVPPLDSPINMGLQGFGLNNKEVNWGHDIRVCICERHMG